MKLKWRRVTRLPRTLECSLMYDDPSNFVLSEVREEHLEPIIEWCVDNNCGIRTSYNHISFKSNEQMTFFLLRWT